MTTNAQAIETERFGTDLVLPGSGTEVQPTASGDWPIITGRDNLLQSHIRRAVTAQGEAVHSPLYGGDMPLFVGVPVSQTALMEIGVRRNALRDTRVADVETSVEEDGAEVTLKLVIHPRGDDTTETAVIAV